MKTVCSYNPMTGEYMGTTEADVSPLEPGVYHMPANATETPPPATDAREAAVWDGQAWRVAADHRGATGYVNGVEMTIQNIGPLPDGWSDAPPAPTVAELRARARMALLSELDEIDRKMIRPLAEIAAGTATAADNARFDELMARKNVIRAELTPIETDGA